MRIAMQRIAVLAELLDVSNGPQPEEFHGSVRVTDLPRSTAFYAWLLNAWTSVELEVSSQVFIGQ